MPEAAGGEQKRRLVRHDVSEQIELHDCMRDRLLGSLVNIHTEGLMLMSDQPVSEDRIYSLELRLGQQRIRLGAECLWSRDSAGTSPYWAGFQIIDISDQALAAIRDLVADAGEA